MAKRRNRSSFEWKTYDIFNQEFAHEILPKNGFKLNRKSRLMYTDPAINLDLHPSVSVKEVSNQDSFEELISLSEIVFGQNTDWLRNGLQHEIIDNNKLVKA